MLKFSPTYTNKAKLRLMRANLGLMDSNDQLALSLAIASTGILSKHPMLEERESEGCGL